MCACAYVYAKNNSKKREVNVCGLLTRVKAQKKHAKINGKNFKLPKKNIPWVNVVLGYLDTILI